MLFFKILPASEKIPVAQDMSHLAQPELPDEVINMAAFSMGDIFR